MDRPLCTRHPVLYHASVLQKRIFRYAWWYLGTTRFAGAKGERLLHTVSTHRSLLVRKLAGTDRSLQLNKITNLQIAAPLISGVSVKPGEVFSFWRLVGRPSASRGFLPGLQLSMGEMIPVTGGGLCQLSNLIHWMFLFTEMTITERHRHGYDAFPDYRRTVPFGSGATVFYNYHDLICRNDSDMTYRIGLWLDEEYINGEITCDGNTGYDVRIDEREHRFVRCKDHVYRENELWRIITDQRTGDIVSETLVTRNRAVVKYDPEEIPGMEISPERLQC